MTRKILIMGLPGAGKTTLARELAALLNAVHFNADEVRENINSDLGFSPEDRIEQARRMGWMCDRVTDTGGTAIADFVCPTRETRASFGASFVIWVDRIDEGRYEDTNKLFEKPEQIDLHVTKDGSVRYWAEEALALIRPSFDPQRPTALMIGRYQPFHDGHRLLVEKALERVDQVCIAVRDVHGMDEKNPLSFFNVKSRIETGLAQFTGRFVVISMPNITDVFYGRDVGYNLERLHLDADNEAISATNIRKSMKSDEG